MSSSSDYTPPKVWTWNKASGGRFANINRPIAGPARWRGSGSGAHMTVSHVIEAAIIMHAANTARAMTRFNPSGMRE